MSQEALTEAIKQLQRMGNIPQTGVIDVKTKELMTKRRCGVKDDVVSDQGRRSKRYVMAPSKWDKKTLTYRYLFPLYPMLKG